MKERETVEREVTEKRIVRDEPATKTTNINVGPDGTTNVQESGTEVVEEEHRVEEHTHRHP